MISKASLPKLSSSIPVRLNTLIKRGDGEDNLKNSEEEKGTTRNDNQVRIVIMSDTHQFYARHLEHLEMALENSSLERRILLHCGDFGFYGQEKAAHNFNLEFLAKIKHLFAYIVVILGNHSSPLMESLDFNVEKFKQVYLSNATHLLFDSNVELCGLTIHGISWKSKREDDFPFSKFPPSQHQSLINKLKMEKYELIPKNVDIILNHEPPQDILDDGSGSEAFRKYLTEKSKLLAQLRIVAFGHAHSKYGHQSSVELGDGSITFINAALNNMNSPFYLDIWTE